MAIEIERKFLVKNDDWRALASPYRITQGYLCREPDRVVRVRLFGELGFITIKGRKTGISRTEFEYAIPATDARDLLSICKPTIIDKTRHLLKIAEFTWEIDEFHGDNFGLIVAEIELSSEDTDFARPHWLGSEVSSDPRYTNSHLSEHPFSTWKES